jgi:hypothetical protein
MIASRRIAGRWGKAMLLGMAAACAVTVAAPASASSAAAEYFRSRADRTAVPALLSQEDRSYYKQMFGAIEREDWVQVQTLLVQRRNRRAISP